MLSDFTQVTFVVVILLLLTSHAAAQPPTKRPLTIAFSPGTPLTQPITNASSGDPCPNVTAPACVGGWARLNALLRMERARSSNFLYVMTVDEQSSFVNFHSDAYAINHVFYKRSQADAYIFQYYFLMGPFEKRTLAFALTAPSLPVLTNLGNPSELIVPAIVNYKMITAGEYNVLLLCMFDSTDKTYDFKSEAETIRRFLPVLRESFWHDLVILKIAYAKDRAFADRLVNTTGVDIVIGLGTNVSTVTYLGNIISVGVVGGQDAITVLDWDPTTRRVTYREYNQRDDIPAVLKDAAYAADQAFLQQQVTLAVQNDPVIGTSSATVPQGRAPCRIRECMQGNFWTQVFADAATTPADIVVTNGGNLRGSWDNGTLKLGSLYASYPFSDSICEFSMWGSDVYTMFNYSVDAAPVDGEVLDGYLGTGRFLQAKGVRLVYNSRRNRSTSPTRLAALEVWNAKLGRYEALSRRRTYSIVASQYLCDGGDGYGNVLRPVDGFRRLNLEVRLQGIQWLAQRGGAMVPFLDGHMSRNLTADDVYVLTAMTQETCPRGTRWVEAVRDCDPCPAGFEQPLPGQATCTAVVIVPPTDTTVPPVAYALPTGILGLVIMVGAAFKVRASRVNRHAPKTGPLCLMFTDVESSTVLWQKHPKSMSTAMTLHHAVIRGLIADYECYEVKTIGDSFMIACPTVADGAMLAIAIQTTLAEQDWPDDLRDCPGVGRGPASVWNGLRVRIGIHEAREVEPTMDVIHQRYDYYGHDVNVAARVEGLALGGQILMSQATYEALIQSPEFEVLFGGHDGIVHKVFAEGAGLKGVEGTTTLHSISPSMLSARDFGEVKVSNSLSSKQAEVEDVSDGRSSSSESHSSESGFDTDLRCLKGLFALVPKDSMSAFTGIIGPACGIPETTPMHRKVASIMAVAIRNAKGHPGQRQASIVFEPPEMELGPGGTSNQRSIKFSPADEGEEPSQRQTSGQT